MPSCRPPSNAGRSWSPRTTSRSVHVAPDLHHLVPAGGSRSRAGLPGRSAFSSIARPYAADRQRAVRVRPRPLARTGGGRRAVVIENAHEADFTDREFLQVSCAVSIRRADRVVVAPARPFPRDIRQGPAVAETAEEPEPTRSARWHHDRASELAAGGPSSPGWAPSRTIATRRRPRLAVEALRWAYRVVFRDGWPRRVVDLGSAPWRSRPRDEGWWRVVHRTATRPRIVEREEDSKALFDRVRARQRRSGAARGRGLRHGDAGGPPPRPGPRDLDGAMAWINQAIAISSLLARTRRTRLQTGFDLNARALIETRLGRPAEALRLSRRHRAGRGAVSDPARIPSTGWCSAPTGAS